MQWNSVLSLKKIPHKRMECFRQFWIILHESSISYWRDSRKAGNLWGTMRGEGGVRKSIHHSWLVKGLGLELLCWGFKGVQEEIPSEEASTLQIGQVAFLLGQYTSPHIHTCSQTIWPRWASRLFITLPIVQTLLPVTFGYSLSTEAVFMRTIGHERGHWHAHKRGHWHAHTRGLP